MPSWMPASSNLALISSASETEIFSLTTPLLSTISLDSFKPKPVISLTTLITPTFPAPASAIDTVTVLGAASAAAPAAAPVAAAADAGEAADAEVTAGRNDQHQGDRVSERRVEPGN